MATVKPKSRRRRLIRAMVIVAGIFAMIILGLHIWFVHNAKGVLQQIVTNKSHGKLKLDLSEVSFDFFSRKLKIREADLVSIDSLNQPSTYNVKFRKLTLRVASFWPLLFKNKLLLDSIKLHDPEIEVMQWRRDTNSSKVVRDDLSIPQEMGRLYNSMLDVLDGFGIKRIMINNAKLSLINKMKPGVKPVIVSNIYFDLFRTARNTEKRDDFVENEQTIDLTTTDQNIALPGGRHTLNFKSFYLQLFRKRIVFDSCTITAISTDSSKSSYRIFFQKLSLIGVDFGAMYSQNLIRADSVYCENPLFMVNLVRSDVTSSKKKERPDAAKIVRELTGDLELGFVGVKDAGINIEMTGSKNRSLFNSNQDDFEMRGLRINSDSSTPVSVERFDMLVRDYHLYNEDSSAAYSFDSIHFINNKIVLNNFTVTTESSRNKQRDERDIRIPYFELTGLDWYQLIFEESMKAEEGYLYNPVINYTRKSKAKSKKKTNLFASLQNLRSLLTLNKINIVNGQINTRLSPTTTFKLENVNLSLYSDKLLQSKNKEGLRRAVERLSFSDGVIKVKDITARLGNVRYTGNNLIHADKLSVSSSLNTIKATVNDVYIDNMLLEDITETIIVDGLRWKNASVTINAPPKNKDKKNGGNLNLKNIAGNSTQLKYLKGKTSFSTFLQTVKASTVSKSGDDPIHIEGLLVTGNKLDVASGQMKIKASTYQVASDAGSFLSNVQIERFQGPDSLSIKSPRIAFTADINSSLAKDIHLSDLNLQSPVVKFIKWHKPVQPDSNQKKPTTVRIDRIQMSEPVLAITTHRSDSSTSINLPHSENSVVQATDFKMNSEGLYLGYLSANTTAATMIKSTGETLGVEKGKVDFNLSELRLSKKDGRPLWSGIINSLLIQNPNTLTIGKSKGKLNFEQATVGNINLSSHLMGDINELIKFNVSAWLRTTSGTYVDSITTLKWYNTEYNSTTRTLSLDSFSYFPTRSRDSVISQTPHQTDYITFHTGAIKLSDFNLEKYKKDSALLANVLTVKNPVITVYRDKFPPFLSGIIKPLPVNMIKRITLPLSIKRVDIVDGELSYTEKNAKTRAEGTIFLTRINGGLKNIKNSNLDAEDSLTLTLKAYLMDSTWINLKVKESYTDSLSGFVMTLKMKPTTLSFLNPVLAPLSNVQITSGVIDSFQLRALANEYLSLGEMKMYYHDLRIKLVKDGNQDKTTFFTKFASFIANTFVIKKNNKGRTGLIYFSRLRDRSFFNYIVKMTFSGMATSIGVKKNRRYIKKYKEELRKRTMPPLEIEELTP